MKKIIGIAMAILLSIPAFNQQAVVTQPLQKQGVTAKNGNNTLAWILTGGGAAMVIVGATMGDSNDSYFPGEEVGTVLMIVGGAAVVTGIVLLSTSSGKSLAAENDMTLNLKMENATVLEQAGKTGMLTKSYYPSLSFRFRIK